MNDSTHTVEDLKLAHLILTALGESSGAEGSLEPGASRRADMVACVIAQHSVGGKRLPRVEPEYVDLLLDAFEDAVRERAEQWIETGRRCNSERDLARAALKAAFLAALDTIPTDGADSATGKGQDTHK